MLLVLMNFCRDVAIHGIVRRQQVLSSKEAYDDVHNKAIAPHNKSPLYTSFHIRRGTLTMVMFLIYWKELLRFTDRFASHHWEV